MNVGVVLDLGTLVRRIGKTSMLMAIDDFYTLHRDYTTRLLLHPRDSNDDVVQAASAAVDLIENVKVQTIIGPQKSVQVSFLSSIASKSHVPLLSFSATSPVLCTSSNTPYFVRTTLNDSSQVPAVASLVKAFGWREMVLVYEDTDYGRDIVPYLMDAFQEINTRVVHRSVIPPLATEDQITKELYKLMTMETRVFIVHMTPQIGSRLFSKAKEVGMMSQGYAWIMTNGLANFVDSLSPSIVSSMQGALGVMVHVPAQVKGGDDNFTFQWQRRFQKDYPNDRTPQPSIYGRWAYDTVWALALAAEKVGPKSSCSYLEPQSNSISSNSPDLERLQTSVTGPRLLNAILDIKFQGVSGMFQIVDGQLQSSAFQIINVAGRGVRGLGFWTQQHGILNYLEQKNINRSTVSIADLYPMIWPGETTVVPRGWENPTSGKKLRIGVPVSAVSEFMLVKKDPITKEIVVSGYCIDVFEEVLKKLPYSLPHEYIPFENTQGQSAGTYDDLVYQVYLQIYDAVVGDTTIRSNRSQHVDFTLPYTESGVAMIAPAKDNDKKNAWIFLKPLTFDLWLGILAFFFFTGVVVWLVENSINSEFQGSISQQLATAFYFSFSTLFFAHRERVEHTLSRILLVIWMFVVLVLTSSYTASLSSMLTVQQLVPTVTDVHELQKNGDYVGYHKGSFIEGLLKQLNFDESKMRAYVHPEEYVQALSKGSKNGGVSAVVEVVQYIKLFLAQHCTGYTMVGPIYKTAGFGFVFPKDSPLVPDISRGILKVMESDDMLNIEKKWFGDPNACLNQGITVTSSNLDFRSFSGLFLITGAVSICSLLLVLFRFWYNNRDELRNIHPDKPIWLRLIGWFKYYNTRDQRVGTSTQINGNTNIRDDRTIESSQHIDEVWHLESTFSISESYSSLREEEIAF